MLLMKRALRTLTLILVHFSLVVLTGDDKIACSNSSVPARHLQAENLCNFCVCSNSVSRCSDLWCGLDNCSQSNGNNCGSQEVCVPQTQEACLLPPCAPRGDCRELEPSKRVAPPMYPADISCWPNQVSFGPSPTPFYHMDDSLHPFPSSSES